MIRFVNKLILIPIIGVIIFSIFLVLPMNESEPNSVLNLDGFSYYDIEKLQNSLKQQNIVVSTPVAITDYTIESYCPNISDADLSLITYCTTTSVVNSKGDSIGNINFGGTQEITMMALATLETSSIDEPSVPIIFEIMIKDLVCDCWAEYNSTSFPDISSWILGSHELFLDSNKPFMKSTVNNLSDTKLVLEITQNENSIIQTLYIIKKV